MKKTKLFTILALFLFTIPLGGCSLEDYSDVSELANYTLSFQLKDEENKNTTIPSYASLYIIGDWNNYSSFLKLEESKGRYKITFSTLSVGTHEYKLALTYSDLEIEWSNAIEFTSKYQTFTVDLSSGKNYTNKIDVTYNLSFPSREEALSNIEKEISSYKSGEELLYDAYLYETYDSESSKTETYYLTSDSEGNTFGTWVEELKDNTTYYYFQRGYRYLDNDGNLSYSAFNDVYTFPLKELTEPFTIFSNNFDISNYEYTLSVKTDGFILELVRSGSGLKETYTYTLNSHYQLIELTYQSSIDSGELKTYHLKEIDAEQVENKMVGFNQYDYHEPSSIIELCEAAYLYSNYTIEITYNTYKSDERATYEEYLADESGVSSTLASSNLTLSESYIIDIYYDTDYILIVQYIKNEQEYTLNSVEFLVDDDGTCWDYYIYDMTYYSWTYDYMYTATWYDYVYWLGDAYLSEALTYLKEDTSYSTDEYLAYYFTDSGAKAYWFACIGTCFMFYSPYEYGLYYFNHYGTFYSSSEQEIISNYYNMGLNWDDDSLTLDTEIYFVDNELTSKIYNVGLTDKRDTVFYYHKYFQQYVEIW